MTLIVSPDVFKSKDKLLSALNDGSAMVYEPSLMGAWVKAARELPVGFSGVVTNHPLRTKFAQIARGPHGWSVK